MVNKQFITILNTARDRKSRPNGEIGSYSEKERERVKEKRRKEKVREREKHKISQSSK